jgi:hypothetical protein
MMALFLVLFHDRSRGYLFRSITIPAGLFRTLLNVFVLALFFVSDTAKMLLARHGLFPSNG